MTFDPFEMDVAAVVNNSRLHIAPDGHVASGDPARWHDDPMHDRDRCDVCREQDA